MTCAIILFTIWVGILVGAGSALNYAASLTNISAISTGASITVLVLQILGILIGIFFVLLYAWSVKKTRELESFVGRKKIYAKKIVNEKKQQIINSKEEAKLKVQDWYDKQWFAIEDETEL